MLKVAKMLILAVAMPCIVFWSQKIGYMMYCFVGMYTRNKNAI